MKRRELIAFGLGLGAVGAGLVGGCAIYAGDEEALQPAQSISYPVAERGGQVDEFFGVKVADPYRWMENTESAQTRAWIDEENRITDAYFAGIPAREKIIARLTKLWDY